MKILGTGSALPKKIVTNDMLSEFLDTSDEWIVPRTGIHSRHVISDEQIEDLGTEAAFKAPVHLPDCPWSWGRIPCINTPSATVCSPDTISTG